MPKRRQATAEQKPRILTAEEKRLDRARLRACAERRRDNRKAERGKAR